MDAIMETLREILGMELSRWHSGGWRGREARSRLASLGSQIFQSQRIELRVRCSQWEREERLGAGQLASRFVRVAFAPCYTGKPLKRKSSQDA